MCPTASGAGGAPEVRHIAMSVSWARAAFARAIGLALAQAELVELQ